MKGLVGKKMGMTRFFTDDSRFVPVTIIQIEPNYITQIRYLNKDGYSAIQVTTGKRNINRVTKSEAGQFLKSNVLIGRGLWEFPILEQEEKKLSVGDIITINIFLEVKKVDVTGISKGKGFSGAVKRWNFRTQDATHGNSLSHRAPGSIGQNQTPGRVFKGKKMAGQLGVERTTIQNLDVIHIDTKNNCLLVKGAVPGSIGGNLIIKSSIKI